MNKRKLNDGIAAIIAQSLDEIEQIKESGINDRYIPDQERWMTRYKGISLANDQIEHNIFRARVDAMTARIMTLILELENA